jgi:hypothetical protein
MSNLLALATELRQLNERLEGGSGLDQLAVRVPAGASRAEIDAAVDAACAARGVTREDVDQVVIVEDARAPAVTAQAAPAWRSWAPMQERGNDDEKKPAG